MHSRGNPSAGDRSAAVGGTQARPKGYRQLAPYEVLDPILEAFIEEDLSVDQIAARGFDRATVGASSIW